MTLYNHIEVYLIKPINGEDYISFATKQQVGRFTEASRGHSQSGIL